jgi:hypothetical protein
MKYLLEKIEEEELEIEFKEIKITKLLEVEKEICHMEYIYKIHNFNLNLQQYRMFL